MPVRRGKDGRWRYRESVRLPDGTRQRISGSAPRYCNTKAACKQELHDHIARVKGDPQEGKESPLFSKWFEGRFWREWVVGRKNKPSEKEAKQSIYRVHLKPAFGDLRLDEIDVSAIARFRAGLVESARSDKTVNNILGVLSKALRYAVEADVLASAPRVGLLRVERPEVLAWSLEEYARLLAVAKGADPVWYAAVCLAGEAGLRIGEVRALEWREDIDLVAGTVTVARQTRRGITGTPKGRTRRAVPMTETLKAALGALKGNRDGYVVGNPDGTAKTDEQTKSHCYRLCRTAELPQRGWHVLRHSFGTHAAMFGVNPWKLMHWMGHKRIDETMRYVHFAEAHLRPLPSALLRRADGIADPDQRVLMMLGARSLS